MNHICTISALNVKGRNFRHALQPLTIIAGDNTSGKTAITDAIIVALLGYHPALGKKPSATIELAPDTAKTMETEAVMSSGPSIRRIFKRTATGAGLTTNGSEPTITPAQLYFADFLNAKPTERHATLASLMGVIDYDTLNDSLKAKLAELGVVDRIRITIDKRAEKPLDQAIAELIDTGRGMKQTVDQHRKTLGTLSAVESVETIDPNTLLAAEDTLRKANEAVGRTSSELDALDLKIQTAPDEPMVDRPLPRALDTATAARNAAAKALADVRAANTQATTTKQALARLRNEVGILEQTATGADGYADLDDEAIRTNRETMITKQDECARAIEAAIANAAKSKQESTAVERQIHQLEKDGTCPCCGTTGQALEAAMQAMKGQSSSLQMTANQAENDLQRLRSRAAKIYDNLSLLSTMELKNKRQQAADRLATLKGELAEAERAIADIPSLEDAQAAERKAIDALDALMSAEVEWQRYSEASVPTNDDMQAARQAFEAAKLERNAAQQEFDELRQKRAAYDQALADENRVVNLTKEADDLESDLKKVEELKDFLQGQKRVATAVAMQPLLDLAGIFMEGVVAGTLAVREHRVGIERGEQFLPLEVLSGAEMLAVSAACQAALASKQELRILIVDEMVRMSPERRRQFADNCLAAIKAGIIGQAILLDQTATAYGPGTYAINCG